jgi:hypothetical protein
MKEFITAIGFAIGLMLAAGTANATTKPTCTTKTDWSKPCEDPVNSQNWTFNNSADASAWAAAIGVGIGQGGDGGDASATGGNANQSQGQSITISNPKQPRFTANFGIGINATILSGVQTNNDLSVSEALRNAGQTCDSLKVLYNTPSAKRAGLGKPNCGGASSVVTGTGFDECSFSKETGKLTVMPRTQYAAEACAITIGMDPTRVKL